MTKNPYYNGDRPTNFHEFCTNVKRHPGYNAFSNRKIATLKMEWEQYKDRFGIKEKK